MLAATLGGQGDTQRWMMLPISLKRKLRPGRGVWALVQPLPHLPGAGGWPAACGWSRLPRSASSSLGCVCAALDPPCLGHGRAEPGGQGGWGETGKGRGPLLGPWWVGERPPGSDCEARPSVTATINMFVQGKPGWELGALAWGGRKGRLCLAHWGDCSCSRNCCPVAGKVRRPSGPLCSLPAVAGRARRPSRPWHEAGRCWAGSEWRSWQSKGRRSSEPPAQPAGRTSEERALGPSAREGGSQSWGQCHWASGASWGLTTEFGCLG